MAIVHVLRAQLNGPAENTIYRQLLFPLHCFVWELNNPLQKYGYRTADRHKNWIR